jgi:hypothetical protein
MMETPDDVVIRLPKDMALAFFEWAHRFMETQDPTPTHPADAVVIDHLASELEWQLPEARTEAYPGLLRLSRERVIADYKSKMGDDHSAWLDALRYQDRGQ